MFDGWRTYHSIQFSFNRRFQNGLSFGFNDTIGLSDRQNAGARLEHAADGSYAFRADQAEADELLGDNAPQTHLLRANFVWDLPDLRGDGGVMRTIGLSSTTGSCPGSGRRRPAARTRSRRPTRAAATT